VPNVSDGRDRALIEALAAAVEAAGARLLDVHADVDHNRSLFTFVGPAATVEAAALALARIAVERLDLRTHQGVHPRIGAVDVIPFVPLRGALMADAVRAAHALGPALAGELGVPVFYYGEAALRPERRELAALRRGQFGELAPRMRAPGGELVGCAPADAFAGVDRARVRLGPAQLLEPTLVGEPAVEG